MFSPVEWLDGRLEAWATGAPLAVALIAALLLGLRHASDPDHLMAIATLQGAGGAPARGAARLGAWWGVGHATTMVAIGVPLIALDGQLPMPVQAWAERLVGVLIVALALRAAVRWWRGRAARADDPVIAARGADFADADADAGMRAPAGEGIAADRRPAAGVAPSAGPPSRTPLAAFAIGVLHGLAGTGAIVLLVLAALPSTATAYLALLVFAPMSVVSMAACSAAWGWLGGRVSRSRLVGDVFAVAASSFAVAFGVWYVAAV